MSTAKQKSGSTELRCGRLVRVRASSVEAFSSGLQLLAAEQREIAVSHRKHGDHGNANACGVIADAYNHIDKNFRRLMELPSGCQSDSNAELRDAGANKTL